jgi:hypothetical protein
MKIKKQTRSVLQSLTDKLLQYKRETGKNLFVIGGILAEIQDGKLYEERCETFEQYLGEPEVSMHRSTAYKCIKVYKTFGCLLSRMPDICAIDNDKLYLITGKVKENPAKAKEWIEIAKSLSRSDLRDRVREHSGKVPKHSLSPHDKARMFLSVNFQFDKYVGRIKDRLDLESMAEQLLVDFQNWKMRG